MIVWPKKSGDRMRTSTKQGRACRALRTVLGRQYSKLACRSLGTEDQFFSSLRAAAA